MTRVRRTGRVLPLGLAVALLFSVSPTTAQEDLEPVGSLPLAPSEALVVDAAGRHLLGVAGSPTPLKIRAYDGDTPRLVAEREHAGYLPQEGIPGSPRIATFDESSRTLYVLGYDNPNETLLEREMKNGIDPRLLAFDPDSLDLVRNTPLAAFPPGIRVLGMSIVAPGRALVLGQVAAEVALPFLPAAGVPRAGGIVVARVDLSSGEATWGPEVVRGCQSAISTRKQAESALLEGAVFVGCASISVGGIPAPGVPAVIEIDEVDPTKQSVHYMPGSYSLGESVWDHEAQRLILVGAAFARPAQAAWIFDLAERVFIGQVTAGDTNVMGAGVNTSNGRLYVATEDGLLVTTDRGIEIPQALPIESRPNYGAITAIPFNGRVVIPLRDKDENTIFTVLEDRLPDSTFPPAETVDFHSFDDLRTESPQFAGAAQAFGLRIHEIGGINAVVQNLRPQQQTNYWAAIQQNTGLRDGDRDLHFGRVKEARLGGDESTASAISAGIDNTTAEDYKLIADEVNDATGAEDEEEDEAQEEDTLPPEWPFETAQCGDFGTGASAVEEEDADVSCDRAKSETTAGAGHGGIGNPGVIQVGASESSAALVFDPKDGLVVTAHAEARDVKVGDDVQIGYVASDAVSQAFGKAKTAVGNYTRVFRNVVAGEFSCSAECNPNDVLAALTRELGTQMRVEVPAAEIVETKGGAHGHAFRDRWEHEQDVVLNNQDPTETQVPALRFVIVADNAVASRVIVELAATRADATYIPIGAPPAPPPFKLPPPPEVVLDIEPIVVDVPAPVVGPPPKPIVTEEIVRTPARAFKVLFGGGARWFGLWALMGVPVFLLLRRRHLLRVVRSRG